MTEAEHEDQAVLGSYCEGSWFGITREIVTNAPHSASVRPVEYEPFGRLRSSCEVDDYGPLFRSCCFSADGFQQKALVDALISVLNTVRSDDSRNLAVHVSIFESRH